MVRVVRAYWLVIGLLTLQVMLTCTLAIQPAMSKIYLRSALFSEVISDSEMTGGVSLDEIISAGFRTDRSPADYRQFLNPRFERELSALKAQATTTDRDLAFAIATRLGDPRDSRICGVESLGKIVFDTDRGQGCCSDFSKAWLFYANYLGLKAREVHNYGHTTVEFFDRQRNRWVWLDPYNKVKFVNPAGGPLNQREIREMSLFESAAVTRLPGSPPDFNPERYEGYQPRGFAVVSWRRGVNFLEVERWDSRMRSWGVPKSLRQLVMLSVGVQPGWVVLATDPMAFYLRLIQATLYGLLAFFIALDVWVGWKLLAWGLRWRRLRRAA